MEFYKSCTCFKKLFLEMGDACWTSLSCPGKWIWRNKQVSWLGDSCRDNSMGWRTPAWNWLCPKQFLSSLVCGIQSGALDRKSLCHL